VPVQKETRIRLASNESPWGPSPKAVEAMRAALTLCNLYPDNDAAQLRRKLADMQGILPEQVLVCAGLTDLLGIICRVLIGPGLHAVSSERSFIVYPVATKAAGAELIEVAMCDDGFDLPSIAAAINDKTRVVFLANPNNPTGTLFNSTETDQFLSQIPKHVTVVLDEAYYDYAQYFAESRGVDYSHSLDYVREERNLLVLRTFSKAHGLAGVRAGYAMGPKELLERLGEAQSTFAVSGLAQAGALAALDDRGHVERILRNNAEGAEFLSDQMTRLGYDIRPTWGNFIYCELKRDAVGFANKMKAEGVIIRPLASWGAPTAIRVTVGTPEQNQIFLDAFRRVAASS
jgi:histidinol-phosphate aminotransferase